MGATEGSPGRDRAPLGARGVWRPQEGGEGGTGPTGPVPPRTFFFLFFFPVFLCKEANGAGPVCRQHREAKRRLPTALLSPHSAGLGSQRPSEELGPCLTGARGRFGASESCY